MNSPANGYEDLRRLRRRPSSSPRCSARRPISARLLAPLYGVASNGFAIAVRKDDDRFPDPPALLAAAKGPIRAG
ncbi:MAG: hypothetical protein R3D25_04510 [Geminicoccaceae bacterium]